MKESCAICGHPFAPGEVRNVRADGTLVHSDASPSSLQRRIASLRSRIAQLEKVAEAAKDLERAFSDTDPMAMAVNPAELARRVYVLRLELEYLSPPSSTGSST